MPLPFNAGFANQPVHVLQVLVSIRSPGVGFANQSLMSLRSPNAGFANQSMQEYLNGHGQLHPTGRR